MNAADMDRLIEQHLAAELAGDPTLGGHVHRRRRARRRRRAARAAQGRDAARGFYEQLNARDRHGVDDPDAHLPRRGFLRDRHQWTGTVHGHFLGIPGHGRRVSIRMLHVWEFADGRISRENLWLDGGSAAAQLSAP